VLIAIARTSSPAIFGWLLRKAHVLRIEVEATVCATLTTPSACNGNDLSFNPATRKGGCRVNVENWLSLNKRQTLLDVLYSERFHYT